MIVRFDHPSTTNKPFVFLRSKTTMTTTIIMRQGRTIQLLLLLLVQTSSSAWSISSSSSRINVSSHQQRLFRLMASSSSSSTAVPPASSSSGVTLDGVAIRQDIAAVNNILVVRVKETLMATGGGILLPDQSKERPTEGLVLVAGPGKLHPHTGIRINNPISAGMSVL
jgi:chaperonin GroES